MLILGCDKLIAISLKTALTFFTNAYRMWLISLPAEFDIGSQPVPVTILVCSGSVPH